MHARILSRAALGDVLASKRRVQAPTDGLSVDDVLTITIPKDCVLGVWSSADEVDIPHLLITADGAETDWLAWVVTYAPSMRPFSAYCRILGVRTAREIIEAGPQVRRMPSGFLGLVLAEVLGWQGRNSIFRRGNPTPVATMSTLSFALVRNWLVHGTTIPPRLIATRWINAQNLTRQRERAHIPAARVVDVLNVLALSYREPTDEPLSESAVRVSECCALLSRDPDVRPRHVGQLLSTPLSKLFEFSEGTREEKVTLLEKAIEVMRGATAPSEEDNFALAYLASQIAPGSLSHMDLLSPVVHSCITAHLWYGVCASLGGEKRYLGEHMGVGRRVARELCDNIQWLDRPSCDIGIEELELFLGSQRPPLEEFLVAHTSTMNVELVPGVCTTVTWTGGRRHEAAASTTRDDRVVARELEAVIARLGKIAAALGGERKGEQQTLFEEPVDSARPHEERKGKRRS